MSLSSKVSVSDVDVAGQRVLARVDFNVPFENGVISNTQRISAAVPTIEMLLERGAKSVVLMSHLGRPDGERVADLTLAPVAEALQELLGKPVTFLEDCVGEAVEAACANPDDGTVILLENLRFHTAETGSRKVNGAKVKATDDEVAAFRASLSKLGDVFVNDAFGTAHRAHSSMVGVDLPVRAAGLLLKKELDFFGATLEAPETPFLAIMGGKKVSDKIKVIDNLLDQVSLMVIGGGMAYTFMSVKEGMSIGKSIFDPDGAETVPALLEKAAANGVEIVLPVDFRCATEFSPDAEVIIRSAADGIPDNEEGLDIGPATEELFAATIATAKTVIWNGPMGVFEFEAFSSGTRSTLEACAAAAEAGSTVVLGGGETAACGFKWGYEERVSHISTGGGASLELMEGKVLPGVAYLSEKDAEATA